MTGSGSRFGANDRGEHGWIDQSHETSNQQQFCRTAVNWPENSTVVTVLVGRALNQQYIGVSTARRLKTADHYGSGEPGFTLHNQRDYLAYMQHMIEAGKRAGFIVNDVDIFSTPTPEEAA